MNRLVSQVTVLPFTQATAEIAANLRAKLEAQGQPIGPIDCLIAGTSLACNGTLVTHNTREFSRVEGLALVDWH